MPLTPAQQQQLDLFLTSDGFLLGTIHATECETGKAHKNMSLDHCSTFVDVTDSGWALYHSRAAYQPKGAHTFLTMMTEDEYDTLREQVYPQEDLDFLAYIQAELQKARENIQYSFPDQVWYRALIIKESHEPAMVKALKTMMERDPKMLAWNIAHIREQLS